MKQKVFILLSICCFSVFAQVNLVGSLPVFYNQGFGTADITTWTNNVTFLGWYNNSTATTWKGHFDVQTASLGGTGLNAGGYFNYECALDNNQKIGSRASGTVAPCDYGVVLRNTTGFSISTVQVVYTAYQMTVAENGNVPNVLAPSYQVTNTLVANPVVTGVFTNIPLLNYTASINSATPGTATTTALPCLVSEVKSLCFDLATPMANNDYFVLRWRDVNDANNDHNIAIDDVIIGFYDQTCAVLPIDDIVLIEKTENEMYDLKWSSETQADYKTFMLQSSKDGVNYTNVQEGDNHFNQSFISNNKAYYRVRGLKYNEEEKYSNMLYLDQSKSDLVKPIFKYNDTKGLVSLSNEEAIVDLKIYDLNGMLLFNSNKNEKQIEFSLQDMKAQVLVFYITPAYHQAIKVKLYLQQ
jgi:hypothetical protein